MTKRLFSERNLGYEMMRPRTVMLHQFLESRESTFGYFNTVKRNGFHIIAEKEDGQPLIYKTQHDHPLTKPTDTAKYSVTGNTLARIDAYLRVDMQCEFTPLGVYEHNQGWGWRLHFEFCVQDKGSGVDNLQALFQGHWLKDPAAYDVSIAVFDIEFERAGECDSIPYDERWHALHLAYPDNVIQRLESVEQLAFSLKFCEGIIAYSSRGDIPYKLKLDRPVCLRIIAVQNTLQDDFPHFKGYNRLFIGVETAESEYQVVHVIDYTEIFNDHTARLRGKCYVNPWSIRRSKETGRMCCTSSSTLGPMLSGLARLLEECPKWKAEDRALFPVYTETLARLKYGDTYRIDRGRSFYFNRGCHFFFNPPPIVVSANEVWGLSSGSVRLQAVKVLAVEHYGEPIYKELLKRPVSLVTLRMIADGKLCRRPDEMMRLVYGRDVDLLQDLK